MDICDKNKCHSQFLPGPSGLGSTTYDLNYLKEEFGLPPGKISKAAAKTATSAANATAAAANAANAASIAAKGKAATANTTAKVTSQAPVPAKNAKDFYAKNFQFTFINTPTKQDVILINEQGLQKIFNALKNYESQNGEAMAITSLKYGGINEKFKLNNCFFKGEQDSLFEKGALNLSKIKTFRGEASYLLFINFIYYTSPQFLSDCLYSKENTHGQFYMMNLLNLNKEVRIKENQKIDIIQSIEDVKEHFTGFIENQIITLNKDEIHTHTRKSTKILIEPIQYDTTTVTCETITNPGTKLHTLKNEENWDNFINPAVWFAPGNKNYPTPETGDKNIENVWIFTSWWSNEFKELLILRAFEHVLNDLKKYIAQNFPDVLKSNDESTAVAISILTATKSQTGGSRKHKKVNREARIFTETFTQNLLNDFNFMNDLFLIR